MPVTLIFLLLAIGMVSLFVGLMQVAAGRIVFGAAMAAFGFNWVLLLCFLAITLQQ